MSKTHWKNMANYDYLGAYSISEIDEIILTIASLSKKMVTGEGGKTDECIVATFKEKNIGDVEVKPMILNKTNCKNLESIYGPFIEDWINKKVIIYKSATRVKGGETKPCLRIRDEIPQEPVYNCCICGKEIDSKFYNGSIKKYGAALCSNECLEAYQKATNKETEGEN